MALFMISKIREPDLQDIKTQARGEPRLTTPGKQSRWCRFTGYISHFYLRISQKTNSLQVFKSWEEESWHFLVSAIQQAGGCSWWMVINSFRMYTIIPVWQCKDSRFSKNDTPDSNSIQRQRVVYSAEIISMQGSIIHQNIDLSQRHASL